MKRSERQKQLLEVFSLWRGQTHQRSEDALISRILDSEEREAGMEWEPEPPAWPKRIFVGEGADNVPILCDQVKKGDGVGAAYGVRMLTLLEYAEAVRRFNVFFELEEIHRRLVDWGGNESEEFSRIYSDLRAIIDGKAPE